MRPLALLVLALLTAGCSPSPAQRYTFEHRADGIYRYDHVAGDIHIMLPDSMGWQLVVSSTPTK